MPRKFSKPFQHGDGWWRVREPSPSAGARVYIGYASGAGARAIRATIETFAHHDPTVAEDLKAARDLEKAQESAAEVYQLLRRVHLGEQVLQFHDLPTLMLWLGELLEAGNPERLHHWTREAIYACDLQYHKPDRGKLKERPLDSTFTGKGTLAALHDDRWKWETALDGILERNGGPAAWLQFGLWCFLEIARPFAAAGTTRS